MPNPLVSIIVAARNAEPTIRSCLNSLSANLQEVPEEYWEVIFVDGGCTDATLDIVRTFSLRKKSLCAPRGISNAYNVGVAAAHGEYTLFLNSDDEWAAGFLRLVVTQVQEQKRLGKAENSVICTSICFIDRCGRELYRRRPPLYVGWIHKRPSLILHPNAAYPTELLKAHPFPVYPDLRPADHEQVYMLMKHARSVRLKEAVYRYRIWANSGTVVRAREMGTKARSLADCALRIACRLYVHAFESRVLMRAIALVFQKRSFWRDTQ